MCNPRRVTISASRDLNEAWQREITRTVSLSAQVLGEARVCQPISATLGVPVVKALESLLDQADDWQETAQGYRHEVEGGYLLYDADQGNLEIVATLAGAVQSQATASEALSGTVQKTLSTEQEGHYYDDNWGGHTEQRARQQAEQTAQQTLAQNAQEQLEAAADSAEQAHAQVLTERAQNEAEQSLQQAAAQRRQALAEQAAQHLDTVGLRCRQSFNQVLAQAYKDAILAYARRNGAENLQCTESEQVVEIEFFIDA